MTTAEGLAGHPVARAFTGRDALQCGYCTPGFVVEAAAFHDRWRAGHGRTPPGRERIAEALAGQLCRCGASLFRDTVLEALERAAGRRPRPGRPVTAPPPPGP
ncbi:2Fe-2S iron-sulfur cluster-binding protein [Streptomyces sp. NPDC001373]|uniref:2Fe-2S iron-sulfur cluster-binding protein n=1 Tax=Streptomyces sp. NPDC001373 TaxID=3364565 RepID=UPI0036987F6F